jgi:hypothetical protein
MDTDHYDGLRQNLLPLLLNLNCVNCTSLSGQDEEIDVYEAHVWRNSITIAISHPVFQVIMLYGAQPLA